MNTVPFTIAPRYLLLLTSRGRDVVCQITMRHRFGGRHRVDSPEPLLNAIEIRNALRVDVANYLRDAERELLLLLRFTLRQEIADAPQDLLVGLAGALERRLLRLRRSWRRLELTHAGVERREERAH